MVRNVRPSWCALSIDHGSNSPTLVKATGPRSRSGSMTAEFKIREHGGIIDLLEVTFMGSRDGSTLKVFVVDKRTDTLLFSETFTM